MSHPLPHTPDEDDDDDIPMLKPKPRRPFELSSPPTSVPTTPTDTSPTGVWSSHLQAPSSSGAAMDGSTTPSRTRSFLNLTSSTLFGIYQPTGYSTEREELSTPWGTGAQTPAMSRQNSLDISRMNVPDLQNGPSGLHARRRSTMPKVQKVHHMPRRGFRGYFLPLVGRTIALFSVGMMYGLLITHLHDRQAIAPVKIDINRSSWTYLVLWGLAGVMLGEALPWIDKFWAAQDDLEDEEPTREEGEKETTSRGMGGWNDVVRSIGAFVGVAFAIRKLPWQSTLQLSLTLALANPAIWFIVDRSPPGFVLSTLFALSGTVVLLGINPTLMPSPTPAEVLRTVVMRNGGWNNTAADLFGSEELVLGIFSQESVGIATWIASVLFVSSVCFGNIGRRLALQKG